MYRETPEQAAARQRAFTYHPPFGDQAQRYQQIRSSAAETAYVLNCCCPPCGELQLAQQSLQQAVAWANAAIARQENKPAPD